MLPNNSARQLDLLLWIQGFKLESFATCAIFDKCSEEVVASRI